MRGRGRGWSFEGVVRGKGEEREGYGMVVGALSLQRVEGRIEFLLSF